MPQSTFRERDRLLKNYMKIILICQMDGLCDNAVKKKNVNVEMEKNLLRRSKQKNVKTMHFRISDKENYVKLQS